VLAFGAHEARRWMRLTDDCVGFGAGDIVVSMRAPAPPVSCKLLADGRHAYALQRAHCKRRQLCRLVNLWEPSLQTVQALSSLGLYGLDVDRILEPASWVQE
jgi:hypothetical protein